MNLNNLQKIFLGFSGLLLLITILWYVVIIPNILILNDNEVVFETSLDSTDRFWDSTKGEFLGVVKSESLWKTSLIEEINSREILLESLFRVQSLNGNLIYEGKREFELDKSTGLAKLSNGKEANMFFPKGVEKEVSYDYWSNDANVPIKINYVGEEKILGLNTFLYQGSISVDFTDGYNFEEGVPEKRRVISEQDDFKIWVEPTGGVIVKYDSAGVNNYHNSVIMTFIEPRNEWKNVFDDKTVSKRIQSAQEKKQKITIFKIFFPIIFMLIIVSLIFGAYLQRKSEDNIDK